MKHLCTCFIFLLISSASAHAWHNAISDTTVAVCAATFNQTSPQMVSDGSGGVIIVWEDRRVDSVSYDLYAQRL